MSLPAVESSMPAPLWTEDASGLAARVAGGEVSAEEVTEAHIARIEATHEALNAVVLPAFDAARTRARAIDEARRRGEPLGPLAGVPVTIKDQFRVVGLPTTLGLRGRHEVDATEGPLVQRLREAGAVILGKTNVPQILFGFETDNPRFGRTNNPWDLERTPFASSGGEAAILAVGGSALGLGGDLGGSVRVPAHGCGIFGLRPSSGRLSMADAPLDSFRPMVGVSPMPGPMARSARDLALAMSVLVDPVGDASDPSVVPMAPPRPEEVDVSGLRIGFYEDDGYYRAAPAIRRAVREAAAALEARGAVVEPMAPPPAEELLTVAMALITADGGDNLRSVLGDTKPEGKLAEVLQGIGAPAFFRRLFTRFLLWKGEQRLGTLIGAGGRFDAIGLSKLLDAKARLAGAFHRELADRSIDAFLCPPSATVAYRHGEPEAAMLAHSYTFVTTILDVPAGVAPVTLVREGEASERDAATEPSEKELAGHEQGSEGLPVGVQVVGPRFREDIVLAVMMALEGELHGRPDWPVRPGQLLR